MSKLSVLKTATIGTAALLITGAAQADDISASWLCTFTTECFEQEACAESAYEVSLTYDISQIDGKPGEGAGSAEIVDVSATRRAIVMHDNGAFLATAVNFEAETTVAEELFQLFASENGEARLISALPTSPLLITYYGMCKAEAG